MPGICSPVRRITAALCVLSIAVFGLVRLGAGQTPDSEAEHAPPDEYPDRIVLTWEEDPSTSLSVTWRTDTTVSDARAQVAPALAEPSFYTRSRTRVADTEVLGGEATSDHDPSAHYHSVTFGDLRPGTQYAYRVGDGENWSEWFHARTADREAGPFSFIYLGDAQNNLDSHWPRAIRGAFRMAPDARFVVHAGDLVDNAHRNVEWGYWNAAGGFIQSMVPNVPVPGNHEYDELGDSGGHRLSVHWRPQFTLPRNGPEGMEETVYHLEYQGMRLIALNTNLRDSARLARQTEWLETALADSDERWTLVTMHHPLFSSGEGRDNPDLRDRWTSLFDRHQVDLVMQGHDHTYARGRLENLTQGVNTRSPAWGTVYVNSVSGAKMYDIKEDRWERYEGITLERGAENTQLYQVVRVSHDTLEYRSYTVTGELYDAFDLVKRPGDRPNEMVPSPAVQSPERSNENTVPYERP